MTSASQLTDGTLGTNDLNLCKTCKLIDCLGHTGYISLNKKIIHPLKVSKAMIELFRYCWNCKNKLIMLDGIPNNIIISNIKKIVHGLKCAICQANLVDQIKWDPSCGSFVSKEYTISIDDLPFSDYTVEYIPVPPIFEVNDNEALIKNYSSFFKSSSNSFELSTLR